MKKILYAIYSPRHGKYYQSDSSKCCGYGREGELFEAQLTTKLSLCFLSNMATCRTKKKRLNNINLCVNSNGDFEIVKVTVTYEVSEL
ncbi:hypothetical protein UFOVP1290_294 [uncultured Caudovirales phage]|uniref:Uncharacterized protein n=1 Tax=uncultured Caudovirales phage TaxID=2100421 RepID=A0A6J5RXM6_9CAUD|nr:hypothetical protein UFOVP1290_294 [uncultured Caudovirales phage]